ncbi:MAG: hypothetical protein IJH84_07050, partial [Saccharopolyspora sp.]|uniref:hypothetical protein n=1 Tax=Saccharopolyspora sp. TaxID=33915 RepID=UPI0025DA482F
MADAPAGAPSGAGMFGGTPTGPADPLPRHDALGGPRRTKAAEAAPAIQAGRGEDGPETGTARRSA